jgi:hypothetical protein
VRFSAVDFSKIMIGTGICVFLTSHLPFPFGGFVLFLLSQLRNLHINTLERINDYGAF